MTEASAASHGLKAYVAVTAAYWAFMLTDGALRMLVLLHFNGLGFSPVQLAYLFILYEVAGIATNLSAGWIAARFGLTSTLYAGLGLQVFALMALTMLDPGWSVVASVVFVMSIQGLSGVAKDLAKMSSKSAVKLLAPEGNGGLFRWVALLTGSKNTVKGIGFFLGAALLALFGFGASLVGMAIVLATVFGLVVLFMPPGLPVGKKDAKFKEVFSKNLNINRLSAARMFLFGARDTWFVVGIPVYFTAVLSDGSAEGAGAAFFLVGGFMALWIIGYGVVQANAPKIVGAAQRASLPKTVVAAQTWVGVLTAIPLVLALLSYLWGGPSPMLTTILILGLLVFGAVFAVNSALHSYLILAFTSAERVTMDVGFYYMSNAAGRLIGTLLSGLSFQLGGLPACLATAAALLGASWIAARRIDVDAERPA